MFETATAFNKSIEDWDVSNVNKMNNMFNGATAFNKYIGDSGLTLIMFAVRIISPKVNYDQKVSLVELCLENGADTVIKSSEGLTVLELAIDEENWIVVEILLNHSTLQGLIPEDKDCLKIYNLLKVG